MVSRTEESDSVGLGEITPARGFRHLAVTCFLTEEKESRFLAHVVRSCIGTGPAGADLDPKDRVAIS
jgi:hypothetical protein